MHWTWWPTFVRYSRLASATNGKQYQPNFVCRCHIFCLLQLYVLFPSWCFAPEAASPQEYFTNFIHQKRERVQTIPKMPVIQKIARNLLVCVCVQVPSHHLEYELPGNNTLCMQPRKRLRYKTLYNDVLSTCRVLYLLTEYTHSGQTLEETHTHKHNPQEKWINK